MTTSATAPTAPAASASVQPSRTHAPTTNALRGNERLSFAHLLRSEWIKLVSLRSTWWTLGATIVGMVGMSALMAISFTAFASDMGGVELEGLGQQVMTFGFFFGQITVAVLGALVITGEYSTGMIRSTFTAAPGRVEALSAKALVMALVVFATALVGGLASWVLSLAILPADSGASFSDPLAWRALLGLALYLTLVALMAFAIGVIVRSSAGAIAAVLGVLLMLPMAFGILVQMGQTWATTIMTYLPSEAGTQLMATSTETAESMTLYPLLGWWQGGLVLFGYVAVLSVIGGLLLRKRDA